MKKLFIIAFAATVFASCNKDLSGLNVDVKRPTVVPSYALFTNAERNFADYIITSDVNTNVFRLITQQWTQTTYTDESNYNIYTRTIPDNTWTSLYRDVLKDAEEAKTVIPTDVTDAGQQKNEIAICDILQVHAYYILVNTFGNIPYSQALKDSIYFPNFDDAQTVYMDLLSRLDADIAALDPNAESFGDADIVYNGDVNLWLKYANSLKLKMGILIADVDPEKAKSIVEAAASNVFTSGSDNAMFYYYAASPNTNPVWADIVQSQRTDFVAANTFIDLLNSLNDPRRPLYFTKDPNSNYSGGIPGKGNSYGAFSHFTDKVIAPDAPAPLLTYSEVEFALAEAAARGMNVGGTAEEHYNKAITASIEEWGGTATEASNYIAQPDVNYATAPGDWRQKIGTQLYIALYNRGFEAWTAIRRLDYPELQEPLNAVSDFPVRFTYPVDEQNINTANYDQAAQAIGGDDVTTKLFWDKN
ncbi:SusD/RagB family nutrient-binding outer membrane lipoprotein [Ilyomonas limi]|uniref:SusD/RagB family nutrient-binding outer membrane lipoprotein n=1 Tax=Ilyomonas limi TaxID=2575867 RepID=A0A4U3KU36_9BACT|nr:SusD/RagB family nutrient-binding outer membrane lipoprotein [Ilyomonas limi]TKK64426.1 SusD/RagB family nutrient-binding outer membrane lipoprotein [Ilyomonas limi]